VARFICFKIFDFPLATVGLEKSRDSPAHRDATQAAVEKGEIATSPPGSTVAANAQRVRARKGAER